MTALTEAVATTEGSEKPRRLRHYTIAYLTGHAILCLYAVLGSSMLQGTLPLSGVGGKLAFALYGISELLYMRSVGLSEAWFNKRSFIGMAAVGLMLPVTYFTGSTKPLLIAISLFCARRTRFEDIARVTLVVMGVSVLAVIVLSQLGAIDDVMWVQDWRVRHGLGFRSSTTLSHYLFFWTLLIIYVRRASFSIPLLASICVINACVFVLTVSRTSCALTFAMLAGSQILRFFSGKKLPELLVRACTLFVPLIAALSIAMMVGYSKDIEPLRRINHISGHRASISHTSFVDNGVKLFGQDLEFATQTISGDGQKTDGRASFIDNSYCNLLVYQGPITLLLVVGGLALLMGAAASHGAWLILLLAGFPAVHAILNPQLLSINFNVGLLLIGPCLLGNKRRRSEELDYGVPAPFGQRSERSAASTAATLAVALVALAASGLTIFHQLEREKIPPRGLPSIFYVLPDDATQDRYANPVFRYVWRNANHALSHEVLGEEQPIPVGKLLVVYDANLTPMTSGTYEISVAGVGSAQVSIDGELIFDIDTLHEEFGKDVSKPIEMPLRSTHPIHIEWTDINEEGRLELAWRTVGSDAWHVIPKYCYFHTEALEDVESELFTEGEDDVSKCLMCEEVL